MVALNVTKPWTATQTTAFSASYTNVTLNKEQSTFPLQSPVTVVDQDIRGYQVDLRHTAEFFKNNLFKIGGQMLSQTSPTGLAPSTGMRTETDMYSLFMWDQHSMFDKKLTFDGGIRMDKKYFGDNDINGTPLHEWSKEIYTYAAGIAYKPIQMLTLTGRYAYSENTPASYQVDAATRSTLPGERRNRYEGGILANFHPAFNPWATLFYYDVKNQLTNTGYYIDSTGNEVNTYTTSNVRYKGVELGFSGQLMKCLSYNLNYTYATSDSEAVNLAIAQHMASGRITYKWKGFDTNLMVRYVGSTNTSSSPAGTQLYSLGDYTRVDANIGYNFKVFERAAKFMVYGQNLGDVHYATRIVSNALYKDPGRVIGARMTISFF
jgi:iron complex outermembrane receptor protein